MSDTSKRPGARDISDLKARLGLKKGAAGAPGSATGSQPVIPGGTGRAGVVAPPGARTGAIPVPPGVQPPQPARPHIPDASHDPFGAMNAMAAHGAVAAQPQIVIVNDGQPVESVEHKRSGARLALMAALVIVPLAIGSVVGKVSAQNKAFNGAIDDAAKLRDDVKVIGKGMLSVQQVLQLGKERGQGNNFLTGDEKLTADLEALQLVEPAFDLLAQLQLSAIGDVLAKETMELYSETARLNAAIKTHVARSKADLKALGESQAKARGVFGYGAIVTLPAADAPAGSPVVVKLAQLGQPVCQGETKPSDKPCPGTPAAFQYRIDDSGAWGTGKVATAEGVGNSAMVLLDPSSKILEGLVKGGGASVAETAYQTRLRDISEKVDLLVELRKNVETKLNNVANRDTRPTFFL